MQAIVHDGYGPPEDLELREIETPRVGDKDVLVRVHAASVNPLDWHLMRGEPSFIRLMGGLGTPKGRIPGADVAGRVEEVGAKVTRFRVGDEVFGTARGAFAQKVCGRENNLALKPSRLSHEQAAAIPIAGCTALQGLRDHGRLRPGQSVLVNGAAGGVGTFAVQIAKTLGAEVTGVCSTRNVDLVRAIGADHVIDYTAEDFTASGRRYDLILNVAGNRTVADVRRALASVGSLVVVGGGVGRESTDNGMLGVLALMLKGLVLSPFVRQRVFMFVARIRRDDLLYVAR